MGVVLTNMNKEASYSYMGFGCLRMAIANAYDNKIGDIYKKIYTNPSYKLTKEENIIFNEKVPKYLNKFLWHSDCDGHFCKRDVKGIYEELIKIDIDSQRFRDLLEVFKDGERIDLY